MLWSAHYASYGRTRTYQPFLAKHDDRLFRNAFTDFKNLGKIAYGRQDFTGLIEPCLDGRTQPGGDLTCQIAATRTVKRESRFLEILFPHNAAYYMTSRTSKSSNDYI